MNRYNAAFAEPELVAGTQFRFPDFVLRFMGTREPSSAERKAQELAFNMGIDGAAAMLAAFDRFEILDNSNAVLVTLELSRLPYAWREFTIGNKIFQIRHAISSDCLWLILTKNQ